MRLKLRNLCFPNLEMYLSQIAKCIFLKIQNAFLSVTKCICLKLPIFCLKFQNTFVLKCKIQLSQIAKCVCLKLQNVFVPNSKTFLSQITKHMCLKLQQQKNSGYIATSYIARYIWLSIQLAIQPDILDFILYTIYYILYNIYYVLHIYYIYLAVQPDILDYIPYTILCTIYVLYTGYIDRCICLYSQQLGNP